MHTSNGFDELQIGLHHPPDGITNLALCLQLILIHFMNCYITNKKYSLDVEAGNIYLKWNFSNQSFADTGYPNTSWNYYTCSNLTLYLNLFLTLSAKSNIWGQSLEALFTTANAILINFRIVTRSFDTTNYKGKMFIRQASDVVAN